MNKIKKIKILIVAMCFILTIPNFSAIVSDNDGSAFITKAEFDSLKSSFNSQITTYNESIDSKIDGAIAQYLAGIKNVETGVVSNIAYDSKGICVADSIYPDWKEGILRFRVTTAETRMGDAGVNPQSKCNSVTHYSLIPYSEASATPFSELRIKQETGSSYAEILGYDDIKRLVQLISTIRNNTEQGFFYYTKGEYTRAVQYEADNPSAADPRMYYPDKFAAKYGIDEHVEKLSSGMTKIHSFSNEDSAIGKEIVDVAIYADNDPTYDAVDFHTITASWSCAVSAMSRVDTIVENHESIFTIPGTSLPYNRFVKSEGIHDWYNDTDHEATRADGSRYHTRITYPSELSDSTAANSGGLVFYDTFGFSDNWGTQHDIPQSSSVPFVTDTYRPYIGYDQNITNWNKLYTTKFDTKLEMIKRYCTVPTLYDGHLPIVVGVPICQLEKKTSIKLEFNFKDKTKNYDVWLKTAPFSTTVEPWNDTGCIPISELTNDHSAPVSAGSMNNSFKINNGVGNVNYTAKSDGFLFIKFAESGSSGTKGGVLYLPQFITTYTER